MTGVRHLIMQHRDVQAAEDVRKMAELGYFDTEITMYGCAYLENGKMYYKVSEEPDDIYRFIESALVRGIYPSDIMKYTEKHPIPLGMKTLIEYDVKKMLAKKLKETYPREVFEIIDEIAVQVQPNQETVKYLWEYIEEIEGLFDETELCNFEIILKYMMTRRKISIDDYNKMQEWISNERKNMENDSREKDIFNKTIYGICYEKNGQLCYENNAQYYVINELVAELIKKGSLVSPVYYQTCGYNYTFRLSDAVKAFKKNLMKTYDTQFMQRINVLLKNNATIVRDVFMQKAEYIMNEYGVLAFETFKMYGYLWSLVNEDA